MCTWRAGAVPSVAGERLLAEISCPITAESRLKRELRALAPGTGATLGRQVPPAVACIGEQAGSASRGAEGECTNSQSLRRACYSWCALRLLRRRWMLRWLRYLACSCLECITGSALRQASKTRLSRAKLPKSAARAGAQTLLSLRCRLPPLQRSHLRQPKPRGQHTCSAAPPLTAPCRLRPWSTAAWAAPQRRAPLIWRHRPGWCLWTRAPAGRPGGAAQ